jgi:hypothetical protein
VDLEIGTIRLLQKKSRHYEEGLHSGKTTCGSQWTLDSGTQQQGSCLYKFRILSSLCNLLIWTFFGLFSRAGRSFKCKNWKNKEIKRKKK